MKPEPALTMRSAMPWPRHPPTTCWNRAISYEVLATLNDDLNDFLAARNDWERAARAFKKAGKTQDARKARDRAHDITKLMNTFNDDYSHN